MYDYSSDSPVLSVIARGRGLLEGGVELDCIDTGTAFSLSVSYPPYTGQIRFNGASSPWCVLAVACHPMQGKVKPLSSSDETLL